MDGLSFALGLVVGIAVTGAAWWASAALADLFELNCMERRP